MNSYYALTLVAHVFLGNTTSVVASPNYGWTPMYRYSHDQACSNAFKKIKN